MLLVRSDSEISEERTSPFICATKEGPGSTEVIRPPSRPVKTLTVNTILFSLLILNDIDVRYSSRILYYKKLTGHHLCQ